LSARDSPCQHYFVRRSRAAGVHSARLCRSPHEASGENSVRSYSDIDERMSEVGVLKASRERPVVGLPVCGRSRASRSKTHPQRARERPLSANGFPESARLQTANHRHKSPVLYCLLCKPRLQSYRVYASAILARMASSFSRRTIRIQAPLVIACRVAGFGYAACCPCRARPHRRRHGEPCRNVQRLPMDLAGESTAFNDLIRRRMSARDVAIAQNIRAGGRSTL
jgi:hypothetical protein